MIQFLQIAKLNRKNILQDKMIRMASIFVTGPLKLTQQPPAKDGWVRELGG